MLATAILVVSLFTRDTMEQLIDVTYFLADRQDATTGFSEKRIENVVEQVSRLPGVLAAEPFREVRVRMTPRTAFAPSLLLFSVPSRASNVVSISSWEGSSQPQQAVLDDPIDMRDRLEHAFSAVSRHVAVAQLQRLVASGRGSGRNGSGAGVAVVEACPDAERGIAAGVQYFVCFESLDDSCHVLVPENG